MKKWWAERKAKKAAKKQAKVDEKQKGPEVYEDKHLSTKATPLGTDTANRVYGTQTKGDLVKPGGETGGYFKPDQNMAPAKNAVGASRLAGGLGMDDIIPDTRFAQLKTGQGKGGKEIGALSKKAQGEALTDNIFDTDVTEKRRKKDGTLPNPEDLGDFTKRKGDKVMEFSGSEINDMDLSRPNTQAGLNRLQWFDALIGNTDRHGGNILVDPESGDVSGIDNDLSFGRGISPKEDEWMEKGDGGKFLGLPDMIDEETSEKLLGLDEEKIRSLLGQKSKGEKKLGKPELTDFSDDEIKDTYSRLEKIQAKIRKLQESGSVVKQWDKSTYDQQVQNSSRGKNWKQQDLPSSYIGRQHLNLQSAKDTKTDWQWRKGHRVEDTTPQPQPQPQPQDDTTPKDVDDLKVTDDLKPPDVGPGGDPSTEDEKEEVEKLVGEPMSTEDALAYIDSLLAEFETLSQPGSEGSELESEDEKDGLEVPTGGMPPLPGLPPRPSVPNAPTGNVNGSESTEDEKEEDEEAERKARFRDAMSKFANV
jgi:hypothetical protein